MFGRPAIALCLLIPVAALAIALVPPRLAIPHRSGPGIVDMAGRNVAVPHPAKRVVMFPPALWDFLTLNRGAQPVLAAARYQIEEVAADLMGKVYPAASRIAPAATAGNTAVPAGAEQLLLIKPDAILSWSWFSDALIAAGLPVVEMGYDDSKAIASDLNWWRVLAAASGQDARALALLAQSRRDSDAVARAVPPMADAARPSAIYIYIDGLDEMIVVGGDGSLLRSMRIAGARNAAANTPYGRINLEQLLEMKPEIMFLDWRWGSRMSPATIYATPAFRSLPAVKNRRVYIVPQGGSRMDSVVEWPLIQRWMAELLYPDRMPKKFREELRATYRAVYGYELSDAEINQTIYLKENSVSAGFDRFK